MAPSPAVRLPTWFTLVSARPGHGRRWPGRPAGKGKSGAFAQVPEGAATNDIGRSAPQHVVVLLEGERAEPDEKW